MARPRFVLHGVQLFGDDGTVVGMRYVGTAKEAKRVAIEEMRRRDGKGYAFMSFPRDAVVEMLNKHGVMPESYARRSAQGEGATDDE